MIKRKKRGDHDNFLSHLHAVMFHRWIGSNITDAQYNVCSQRKLLYFKMKVIQFCAHFSAHWGLSYLKKTWSAEKFSKDTVVIGDRWQVAFGEKGTFVYIIHAKVKM